MRFDVELTNDEYMGAVDYWSRNHKEITPQAFYEGIYYHKHYGYLIEKTLAYQFTMMRRELKRFVHELIEPFRRLKRYILTGKKEVQFLEFRNIDMLHTTLRGEIIHIKKLVVDVNEIYSLNETADGRRFVLSLKVHPEKTGFGRRVESFVIQEQDYINAKRVIYGE